MSNMYTELRQVLLADHNEHQIRRETQRWYRLNLVQGYNSRYLKVLHKVHCDNTQMQVTFDVRFADAIIYCINSILCTSFQDTDSNSLNMDIFIKMGEQLYETGLIGKRHLYEIKSIRTYNITNKINQFMNRVSVGKFSVEQMEQHWQQIVLMSLLQFWNAVIYKKVKQAILLTLHEFIGKAPSIANYSYIGLYVQDLQRQLRQQQESHLKKLPRLSNQKQQELDSTKDQNICYDLAIVPNEPQIKVLSQIQERLRQVAFYYSMFYNPLHQSNLTGLNRLINFVRCNILVDQQFRLQLFGSLKSAFALWSQYDIDLNYLSLTHKQIDRLTGIKHLRQLQKQFESKPIPWYKKSQVIDFEDMAIPFLKIEIDPYKFRTCFGMENITKIDFTFANRGAAINSLLLSHYSEIPEIHFFCILVKFWAKSRHVINKIVPLNGLSSYVVIMMCIYYLMETGQIDFIEMSEQEQKNMYVGTFVPNLGRLEMMSLYQNFKGFLEFYGEAGKFQKERKVVCLLKGKMPKQFKWNQDLIVNVYDFIDKTNPGRLTMLHRDFQFKEFRRALKLLKHKTIAKISQIFQKN